MIYNSIHTLGCQCQVMGWSYKEKSTPVSWGALFLDKGLHAGLRASASSCRSSHNSRALVPDQALHVFVIQNSLKYRRDCLMGVLFIGSLQFLYYLHTPVIHRFVFAFDESNAAVLTQQGGASHPAHLGRSPEAFQTAVLWGSVWPSSPPLRFPRGFTANLGLWWLLHCLRAMSKVVLFTRGRPRSGSGHVLGFAWYSGAGSRRGGSLTA